MKLMYLTGPGNIIGTFEHWKNGKDDPSQLAITYSGQFYETCAELGAEAYVISPFGERNVSPVNSVHT
jgi:hypothetical protein